jgi:APA family basic amino acid/polyamine antiporter
VSCFGALNGWIFLTAEFPRAAAKDGLFPHMFARLNARGVPGFGLGAGIGLVTLLLAFNYSGSTSLVSVFNFTILLSTLATLIPFVFCSVATFVIGRRFTAEPASKMTNTLSVIAFIYSGWMIYGAGAQVALLGLILMVAGIPVYVWLRKDAPAS